MWVQEVFIQELVTSGTGTRTRGPDISKSIINMPTNNFIMEIALVILTGYFHTSSNYNTIYTNITN